MNTRNKYIAKIFALFCCVALLGSCKPTDVVDAEYLEQSLYIPAGVPRGATASNYNYDLSALAVPGQSYRYVVDAANNKFNVPLSVYRSGIDNNGSVNVEIATKTDTVTNLITSGKLPASTEIIPADKVSLSATAITIKDGEDLEKFNLSVDLPYLLANASKTLAIGVGISSTQRALAPNSRVVIVIKPAFLIPTAVFTSALDASGGRKYNFTNTSANGLSYLWDFGDGTPTSTDKSPSHVYSTAGAYTVKLTTIGAAGEVNKAVATLSLTVL
jgi:PKD repeat protein